jgi:transposase
VTTIAQHADAIQAGETVVLYVDQCHLTHGDARGYVWGPSHQRMVVPIANSRERQTYYGAVDPLTGELTVMEAIAGDAAWTVRFLAFLQEHYAGKSLLICWDGASYHRSQLVRAYLQDHNAQRLRLDWRITCIQFAPYAPQQNPIEDVWLQVKSRIRRNWQRMDGTFQAIKDLFEDAVMTMPVDFPKLRQYTPGLRLT